MQTATPLVLTGCAAQPGIGVPASLNETVPPPGVGLTDAAKVTSWPATGVAGATVSSAAVATAGTRAVDAGEAELVPAELVAVTVKV